MDHRLLVTSPMRWVLCGLLVGTCSCAEAIEELAPVQPPIRAEVLDTFWLHEAIDESSRPPLERARSISLGNVGDTPLTGGVMRDTPMPMPMPMSNFEEPQEPHACACALR